MSSMLTKPDTLFCSSNSYNVTSASPKNITVQTSMVMLEKEDTFIR